MSKYEYSSNHKLSVSYFLFSAYRERLSWASIFKKSHIDEVELLQANPHCTYVRYQIDEEPIISITPNERRVNADPANSQFSETSLVPSSPKEWSETAPANNPVNKTSP